MHLRQKITKGNKENSQERIKMEKEKNTLSLIFQTKRFLGYDIDEKENLVINKGEAKIVNKKQLL